MILNKFDPAKIWAKNCQLIVEREYLRKENRRLSKIIAEQDILYKSIEALKQRYPLIKMDIIPEKQINYYNEPGLATCDESIDGLCHTELLPCDACPTPKVEEHTHIYVFGNPNCIICGSRMLCLPDKEEKNHGKDEINNK